MGCVGSPTDVHWGKWRAVAPPGRRLTAGRGVALSLSVPLPSLGRQQSGRHWRCAVHGGRGPPYHSGSCSPSLSGYDLCGVPVRRRGPVCSSRPPCGPAAGAGGRVTLRPPSRVGGPIPLASGGVSRCGLPALVPGGGLWYPFLALPSGARVRSGLTCRPGAGGGVRGGPWTAPLGAPADLQTPPLSPRSGLWSREGHVGRGLLRAPLCALLRHAGVGSWGQVQPPLPLPCRRSSCGWGRPPGPGGAEGRACGSPAGVGAGGGVGGPPRLLSGLCGRGGGGGGSEGGSSGSLAMPPVGQKRGGGGRLGGPSPGGQPSARGAAPFPRPPLPSAGSSRSPSLGPLISRPLPRGAGRPRAAVRVSGQWLAGCGAAFPG